MKEFFNLRIIFGLLCYVRISSSSDYVDENIFIGRSWPGNFERKFLKHASDAITDPIRIANIGREKMIVTMVYGGWWTNKYDHHTIIVDPFKPGDFVNMYEHEPGYTSASIYSFKSNKKPSLYYAIRTSKRIGLHNKPSFTTTNGVMFEHDIILFIRLLVNMKIKDKLPNESPLPNASSAWKFLLDLFFPDPEKINIWIQTIEKIKSQMQQDTRNLNAVHELGEKLAFYMDPLRKLVDNIYEELTNYEANTDISDLYIAGRVILNTMQYENIFPDLFKDDESNYYTLPLFVRIVNMKLIYYGLGIAYPTEFRMTIDQVRELEASIATTVAQATDYINKMQDAKIDDLYDRVVPSNLFNVIMTARSYIGIAALKYFDDWNRAAKNIHNTNLHSVHNFENSAIIYSEYFGRTTPKLYLQPLASFGTAPLTPPKLSSNQFAHLESLEICEDTRTDYIFGIKLRFNSGNTYDLGNCAATKRKPFFIGEQRITKITVAGIGKVDYMKFYLSNGSVSDFGKRSEFNSKTFEYEDHYIASLVAYNDDTDAELTNIAVSYRLNPSTSLGKIPDKYLPELTSTCGI